MCDASSFSHLAKRASQNEHIQQASQVLRKPAHMRQELMLTSDSDECARTGSRLSFPLVVLRSASLFAPPSLAHSEIKPELNSLTVQVKREARAHTSKKAARVAGQDEWILDSARTWRPDAELRLASRALSANPFEEGAHVHLKCSPSCSLTQHKTVRRANTHVSA